MKFRMRPASRGHDRRDGRSLTELLAAGSVRRDSDPTPPHGIARPDLSGIEVKDDEPEGPDDMDLLSPEDVAHNEYWNDYWKYHEQDYPMQKFIDKGYPPEFFKR
jgi:hypothetical protein